MHEGPGEYRLYGRLDAASSAALASTLIAKGLPTRFIEETASLSLMLQARAGREEGPYLRTPDGFLLGGLHQTLSFLERIHPEPALVPRTALRSIVHRLLEDWILCWLSELGDNVWPEVEALGEHLSRSRYLLGEVPARADWMLAAWLETDLALRSGGRAALLRCAPVLEEFAAPLLDMRPEALREEEAPDSKPNAEDDVIPITLLGLLRRIAETYHVFLGANQKSLANHADEVVLDPLLGCFVAPTSVEAELRRAEAAAQLRLLSVRERAAVQQILEPVGAWEVLGLETVLEPIDPADPRSLEQESSARL